MEPWSASQTLTKPLALLNASVASVERLEIYGFLMGKKYTFMGKYTQNFVYFLG
jgi:hypothetical protein